MSDDVSTPVLVEVVPADLPSALAEPVPCYMKDFAWSCGVCSAVLVTLIVAGNVCTECRAVVSKVEFAAQPPTPAAGASSSAPGAGLTGGLFSLPDGRSVDVVRDPDLVDWVALVSRVTGLAVPKDQFLQDYQRDLLVRAFTSRLGKHNTACVCGRDVREWKRRFHLSMRKQLWAIAQNAAVNEEFRLEPLLAVMREKYPTLGLPTRSDESKLHHLGLITRVKKDPAEVRRENPNSGVYRLTQFGLDVVEGRKRAPLYSYFYNAFLLAVSEEETGIRDDSDRFDWLGLMEGTGG